MDQWFRRCRLKKKFTDGQTHDIQRQITIAHLHSLAQVSYKLIHIRIRNKYCYVWQHAESVDRKPKEHQCFKNWDSSSQAMEADIILEGFLKANEYGVRYMTVIADGDTSTYACIQEEVPVWGRHVKKGNVPTMYANAFVVILKNVWMGTLHIKGKVI